MIVTVSVVIGSPKKRVEREREKEREPPTNEIASVIAIVRMIVIVRTNMSMAPNMITTCFDS